MSHNYPEHILKKLREYYEDCHDTYTDEDFQEMGEADVFAILLEQEGIIGYDYKIMSWIKDVWGYNLVGNGICEHLTKADTVRAFSAFIKNHDKNSTGVQTMELDDEENKVTITYRGGGTHTALVGGDSFIAMLSDIIKKIP